MIVGNMLGGRFADRSPVRAVLAVSRARWPWCWG